MFLARPLGMIPAWQYDQAWPQNPNYNNHVTYPAGWNQLTSQPQGPWYAPPGEAGLGRLGLPSCCENCACGESCPGCPSYGNSWSARLRRALTPRATRSFHGMRGLGAGFGSIDPKWYAVGGVTLLSIAAIIGAKAFLK